MKRTYPAPSIEKPLVLSSSAIGAFKRCRRMYEYGYEQNIDGGQTQVMADGTSVHEHLARAARGESMTIAGLSTDAMAVVAKEYLDKNPLPIDIIAIEEPFYWEVRPNVFVRCTFDLVYRDANGFIVIRDYKTFEKQPTLDVDLDFQCRFYIACAMKHFKTDRVRFEYEYIRRVPPGTPNSKGFWTVDQCYTRFPVIISHREAMELYDETMDIVDDLLIARATGRFYHQDLKGNSPYTCGSCLFKNICKAEIASGDLTPDDVALLGHTYRTPLSLPEELHV